MDSQKKNIAVLVSGGGTNLQALIDAEKNGDLSGGHITCVISSKDEVFALKRAESAGIPARVIARKDYCGILSYSRAILKVLDEEKADLVVLAGFMTILDSCVTKAYEYRIINVHPSLIPSFCGEGFYGLRVHEAALRCGVKYSGATVHFVNENADDGAIILQKPVEVLRGDTPEILQKRIMEQAERVILPRAAALFCQGRIDIIDGKAFVRE